MQPGPHFIDKFVASQGLMNTAHSVELSVVMPAFNEVEGIEAVLQEWSQWLTEEIPSHELIVINDGSTDGTGRVLDRLRKEIPSLRVIHQLNAGHGKAVRRGYELSRGTFLLQADPNSRFEPTDLIRLWELRNQFSLIVGYRTHRLDALTSRILDTGIRRISQWAFGSTLTDPSSSFRLLRRESMVSYLSQLPVDLSSVDICLAAVIQRWHPERVAEVPVPYRKRKQGLRRKRPRSLLWQALGTMRDLIAVRFSSLSLKVQSERKIATSH